MNEDGGVLGCELALDVLDDTSDYTKSPPMLQGGTKSVLNFRE